ncbi:MAG: hypothetical protein ACREEE_00750 [Dongiaceae bacterium]
MSAAESADAKIIPLDLPFKGSRQYLHGTDIFNAVISLMRPQHGVAIRLHRVMRHPIDLLPADNLPRTSDDSAGSYSQFEADGSKRIWLFCENRSRQVMRRIPYDENDIVADAVHRDGQIMSPGPSNYTFIERIVALHKAMLRSRSDLGGTGAWLFTHLDVTRVPWHPGRLELKLASALGTTMVKSVISCDGATIGHIAFWSVKE